MDLHHILILGGLLFELAGAFILAAEAIGLDKLDRWITNLRRTRREMKGEQTRQRTTFLDPNRFIAGFGSIGGVALAYWVSLKWIKSSSIMGKIMVAIVGGLFAIILGLFIYKSVLVILQVIIKTLRSIELRVQLRAVGTLGFGLLAFGFCLQFIGTIIDGLNK